MLFPWINRLFNTRVNCTAGHFLLPLNHLKRKYILGPCSHPTRHITGGLLETEGVATLPVGDLSLGIIRYEVTVGKSWHWNSLFNSTNSSKSLKNHISSYKFAERSLKHELCNFMWSLCPFWFFSHHISHSSIYSSHNTTFYTSRRKFKLQNFLKPLFSHDLPPCYWFPLR